MFVELSYQYRDWKPKVQSKHIVFNNLKSHFFGGWADGFGGVGRKYYYTGGLRETVTKCSVQESFVIKIVYTVKSECLFFF